jgi:hypothetical protein
MGRHCLELQKTREENVRIARDSREELDRLELQYTKSHAQAQIRAFETEARDWANEFPSTNTAPRLAKLREALRAVKAAQDDAERATQEMKRKFSIGAYPPLHFALSTFQQLVQAYAEKAGQRVILESLQLPDDLNGIDCTGKVTFPSGAVWSMRINNGGAPGREVWLRVTFNNAKNQETGQLDVVIVPAQDVVQIGYKASIPVPDPVAVNGKHTIAECQTPIKRAWQHVLATQLLFAVADTLPDTHQ